MKRLPGQLLVLTAALGILSCAAPVVASKPAPAPGAALMNSTIPKPPSSPVSKPARIAPSPSPPKPGAVSRIPLGTFFEKQQTGQVITYDVRPAFHYSMGHIPSAINWPRNRFQSGLPQQEPRLKAAVTAGKPIVLYCTDLACPDARTVAAELSLLGYDTAILAGGWEAWKLAELPTE